MRHTKKEIKAWNKNKQNYGSLQFRLNFWKILQQRNNVELTMSGVLAPSVCEVESAVDLFALLLVSPRSDLPPSRSSMTRSMGILPFRQEMYRWQKLSQSSWTWNKKKVKIESYRLTYRQTDSVLINNYKYIYQCIYRHHLIKWNKKSV